MINSREVNRQIGEWTTRAKKVGSQFKGRERKRVLRAGAQPLIKTARSLTPRSSRPHYRYPRNGDRVKINPGNLRRSIKVPNFRRSQDVFIGPKQGKTSSAEIGGPGQQVDGYYAQMLFGSARAFNHRILRAASRASGSEALTRIKAKAITVLRRNARKNRVA
mgnify:CR=1 FL=1